MADDDDDDMTSMGRNVFGSSSASEDEKVPAPLLAPPKPLNGEAVECDRGLVNCPWCTMVARGEATADEVTDRSRPTTPLIGAVESGAVGCVRWLLRHGANASLTYRTTALHAAASSGHLQMLRLLHAAGANVNARDSVHSQTVVMAAVARGHAACVEWLHTVAGAELHPPVDACPRNAESPLTIAALLGHVDCVRLLLRLGVDPNFLSPVTGGTALHSAARAGHVQCVGLLCGAGAKVDVKGLDGNAALFCAALNGHAACVAVLLRHGADVNLASMNGLTALHAAAQRGHAPVMRLLVATGTLQPSVAAVDGSTAAKIAKSRLCSRILHGFGADVS